MRRYSNVKADSSLLVKVRYLDGLPGRERTLTGGIYVEQKSVSYRLYDGLIVSWSKLRPGRKDTAEGCTAS
jgi:hypothetical protein